MSALFATKLTTQKISTYWVALLYISNDMKILEFAKLTDVHTNKVLEFGKLSKENNLTLPEE